MHEIKQEIFFFYLKKNDAFFGYFQGKFKTINENVNKIKIVYIKYLGILLKIVGIEIERDIKVSSP